VWVTTVYTSDQHLAEVRYRSTREAIDFDCATRSRRLNKVVFLTAEGRTALTSEFPDAAMAAYRPVDPESGDEFVFDFLCTES
jgi:hypothetical protein